MKEFTLNGDTWTVVFVNQNDPRLIDREGRLTVGTTDPRTGCIYLSNRLKGEFLITVLVHEIGHCAMVSFGLLDALHRMVIPKYWIELEEWVCNFIADYGMMIFRAAYGVLGYNAVDIVPYEIEQMIA